jgi:hypothetical protein
MTLPTAKKAAIMADINNEKPVPFLFTLPVPVLIILQR